MWQRTLKNDLFPLLKLAIPLALTGLIQSAVFFFETLFLARLGYQTLAAGALVSWLFGTLVVIAFGTLSSVNVLISHKFGAKDNIGISLVLRDGLILAFLFTIPSFILFWYTPSLFLLFGQTPNIVVLADSYMHALAWGLLPDFIMIVFLDFLAGLGHTRAIVFYTLLSVPFTIFCSYVFIFGKFGFPALGIAGAGWGVTVSYWITAVLLSSYILFNSKYRKYVINIFQLSKTFYLKELLKIGVPTGLMYCIEVAFFLALAIVMGNISSQALAANQIVMQYLGSLMALIFSIAQAVTVRMGHQLGANEIIYVQRTSQFGVLLAVVFMSGVAIWYWFFPEILISVDLSVNNPSNFEVAKLAKQFFAIAAIFQILEAARIALFGALRAFKDTRFTLYVSIISFWLIALPLGYLLGIYLRHGGQALWWAMVLGAASSILILSTRLKFKYARLKTQNSP